ncbi:MAG: 1-deoxy-D-xylulose-5-phosphate reductoisomerase [Treponema sp.]|nr:1-deoxy-D-xylulose-5-phosphate reductoisomerase [Treponema sp.]MCL2251214.1 1-deoxy-D-xylulose-5-phosphate reductoisomerase [Treponema sp.]
MKKRIAVLGATGSIGESALDIISQDTDNFEVILLTAHSSLSKLEQLKTKYPNSVCVLTKEENGKEKLLSAIKNANADIIINGISGAAGLEPSIAAIEAGCRLALANKETLVMAGKLVLQSAKEKNVNIIPVDSEHSAIFHLLKAHTNNNEALNEIILTASGGPFRNFSVQEMEKVTAQEALAHPTWKMGPKITIDSASMANKGLEIIEACVLFNLPPEKIKVVIHPQSIVHAMIRLNNGVFYAQLSKPDMRHPIHDALYWPHTAPSLLETLNFDCLSLVFLKPENHKFPMLDLAWNAAKQGALYPCAYNAANETAVCAFLEKKIGFLDIPRITEHVLEKDWSSDISCLEAVIDADRESRIIASDFIKH